MDVMARLVRIMWVPVLLSALYLGWVFWQVEKVWPAVSRCFDVTPAGSTRYTLTAEGAEHTTVSESIEIAVKR